MVNSPSEIYHAVMYINTDIQTIFVKLDPKMELTKKSRVMVCMLPPSCYRSVTPSRSVAARPTLV